MQEPERLPGGSAGCFNIELRILQSDEIVIGKTIAQYRILERLGQGDTGRVYLAEDTTLDRKVGLKVFSPAGQQDEITHARLLREANSAATLLHPFICTIYEIGEDDGVFFIAMEHVEGQSLAELLRAGRLSVDYALRLGCEIAEALEVAHERGIVHRNLKPSNIMLTSESHAKLMDFGLARTVAEEAGDSQEETLANLTQEGSTLENLSYMSPEQVLGREADPRSDIFAFGVLLYEMVTGVHPFRKNLPVETVGAVLNASPPPMIEYKDDVPGLLEHTLSKMLAKDPDQRYQSIRDVSTNLQRLYTPPEEPVEPAPDQESWVTLVGILAVTLILLAALAWWALR